MQFDESIGLIQVFDSFLHDGVWNVDEHQAAKDWVLREKAASRTADTKIVQKDFPWALFEGCKQAKKLEQQGIFRCDEFAAEKEWLYNLHSDVSVPDYLKIRMQKERFDSFENAKRIYDEERSKDSAHALENFELRKEKIRFEMVLAFC